LRHGDAGAPGLQEKRIRAEAFWPATTRQVRDRFPGFRFMAEVYWDLEWTLQQQGFDYTYDKRLYDRLRDGHATPVREHFRADIAYQSRMARFLENHDEPRAAATFARDVHEAAAVITFVSPGLRFFHQGQLEGRRTRISPHLVRAPDSRWTGAEPVLRAAARRAPAGSARGHLAPARVRPAWEGNGTNDCFSPSPGMASAPSACWWW
jgi:hypothetical protein